MLKGLGSLGKHLKSWGSKGQPGETLSRAGAAKGIMGKHSKGLGQRGAVWGSPLKGRGSFGKPSKGKHSKGFRQHGAAW